jgi:RNA polymerase sigma-70 factor (ECF subfamily)
LRLARDAGEAQDCLQETFVRAWQRLGDFRGDSRLGTWLHRIAVNEVLGRRRHEAIERRHLSLVDPGARRTLDDSATLQDLERAVGNLPDRARDVFVLRAIYGYTHEEIAGLLEITVSTSKTQHHRARKLLMAALPDRAEFTRAEPGDDALDAAAVHEAAE